MTLGYCIFHFQCQMPPWKMAKRENGRPYPTNSSRMMGGGEKRWSWGNFSWLLKVTSFRQVSNTYLLQFNFRRVFPNPLEKWLTCDENSCLRESEEGRTKLMDFFLKLLSDQRSFSWDYQTKPIRDSWEKRMKREDRKKRKPKRVCLNCRFRNKQWTSWDFSLTFSIVFQEHTLLNRIFFLERTWRCTILWLL